MPDSINVTEARARLPELLDRVVAGEEITLTRHGQPVAVVIRPDALRTRRADRVLTEAVQLRELIDAGRITPLSDQSPIAPERADELVKEINQSRRKR